jgi:origin recognition complex subunit 2
MKRKKRIDAPPTIAEETEAPSKKHSADAHHSVPKGGLAGDSRSVSASSRRSTYLHKGERSEAESLAHEINDIEEDMKIPDGEENLITTINTPSRGRMKKAISEDDNQPIEDRPGIPHSLYSTPKNHGQFPDIDDTPRLERNIDRSARRKSTRTLIERTMRGTTSENDDEDRQIAQYIYGSGEEDTDEEALGEAAAVIEAPATPSKKGKSGKLPTRPLSPDLTLNDLSAHEKYFFENRGGRVKTSDNNLSSLALLDHEEYFSLVRGYKDPHAGSVKALQEIYEKSFKQWDFELSQQFSLCLYGWGSKRSVLMKFADHIYQSRSAEISSKIVVINGYIHNLTIKDVLNAIAGAISQANYKVGSQAVEMVENVITSLEENPSLLITLIVHSIDKTPLRRPVAQAILSRLSAHPQIRFIASADHPSFPLLWDSSLRATYNFLFHDCTTFEPYTVEVDVVDEVHDLLGRSGRRVGGKEGVSFVLKSLPENAKNLFRILIGEQLASIDGNYGNDVGELESYDRSNDVERRTIIPTKAETGVEYRVLYQKAVEEFICSNEMNFRTLLKE